MRALICECCGGTINPNTYVCEYCGTPYERDSKGEVIRIETFQNPIKVYKVGLEADDMLADDPDYREYAVKTLARQLGEAMAECMEMETVYNPYTMRHRITARVRVVEPKHLF